MMARLLHASESGRLWTELNHVILGLCHGADNVEVLRDKNLRRTFRLSLETGDSVIVKTWLRQAKSPMVYRAAFRWTTAYREWRVPQVLARYDIPAPHSLAYFSFVDASGAFGEAVVLEDLGACIEPTERVKSLLMSGDEDGLVALEREIVSITARLIDSGFLDIDHRLMNFVLTPRDQLLRVDFEHCRRFGRRLCRALSGRYGTMLGTLIGSYAFAVQPRDELPSRLAGALADELRPPRRALARARSVVNTMMTKQIARRGIETQVALPW